MSLKPGDNVVLVNNSGKLRPEYVGKYAVVTDVNQSNIPEDVRWKILNDNMQHVFPLCETLAHGEYGAKWSAMVDCVKLPDDDSRQVTTWDKCLFNPSKDYVSITEFKRMIVELPPLHFGCRSNWR